MTNDRLSIYLITDLLKFTYNSHVISRTQTIIARKKEKRGRADVRAV